MSCFLELAAAVFAAVSFAGIVALIFIALNTRSITDFLCLTNWFGKYTKINQRIIKSCFATAELRWKYRHEPIKKKASAIGCAFKADFEKLFSNLETDKHYRVTTHYKAVMNKAKEDGLITYISEPAPQGKRRMIRELRPLIGWGDYMRIKRCILCRPQKKRCCEVCRRRIKCECKKGGVCLEACTKEFVRYDFVVNIK